MSIYKCKLELSDDKSQYVFTMDEVINVKYGNTVKWTVDVKDAGDVSNVGLLVVFHGSNSESNATLNLSPQPNPAGCRNWPFNEPSWSYAPDPNDPKSQNMFAIEFGAKYNGSKNSTATFTVDQDVSLKQPMPGGKDKPLPIVYNYSLLASIPWNQNKSNTSPSSTNPLIDWPDINTAPSSNESGYVIVRCDPEMEVDEC